MVLFLIAPAVTKSVGKVGIASKITSGVIGGGIGGAIGILIQDLFNPKPVAKTDLKSIEQFLGYSATQPKTIQEEIPPPFEGGQSSVLYAAFFQLFELDGGDTPVWLPQEVRYGRDIQGAIQNIRMTIFSGLGNISGLSVNFYERSGVRGRVVPKATGADGIEFDLSNILCYGIRFSSWKRVDGQEDTGGSLPPIQPEILENTNKVLELQPSTVTPANPVVNKTLSPSKASSPVISSPVASIPQTSSDLIPQSLVESPGVQAPPIPPLILPELPKPTFVPSPSNRFLPDRVIPKGQPKPNQLPGGGLVLDSSPANPNQIDLKKQPKREPLPVPFGFPKVDFDCEKLRECVIGDGLNFDISDSLNDIAESVNLGSPSCEEQENGDKIITVESNTYTVPGNLGEALTLLNQQLIEIYSNQCLQTPYIVGVPDAWEVKRATYPKQIIMKFRSERVEARFYYKKIVIPHIIDEVPNYNIDVPAYTSGNYYLRIYFKDGSFFHIYVDSESTAENILNHLVPLVEPSQLYDPIKFTIANKQGSSIAIRNWKPIEKTFYSGGDAMKFQRPVWTKKFANNPN